MRTWNFSHPPKSYLRKVRNIRSRSSNIVFILRMTPARSSEGLTSMRIYFQNDDESKKCLNQWKSQCLEWCKDKPEDGKFADQKYLDSWPRDFRKLLIHSHPGANLAPWNLKSHLLSFDQKVPTVDGQPAIFYHFSY